MTTELVAVRHALEIAREILLHEDILWPGERMTRLRWAKRKLSLPAQGARRAG